MDRKLEKGCMSSGFLISVSSDLKELWRYNIALVCQCLDTQGEQIEVCAESSYVADVGENLAEPPEGSASRRGVVLTTPSCENIEAICYLIPHTLPVNRIIDESAPFDLRIKIERAGKMLYDTTHKVNQWSGASITVKL